jgi:hypothetical protein
MLPCAQLEAAHAAVLAQAPSSLPARAVGEAGGAQGRRRERGTYDKEAGGRGGRGGGTHGVEGGTDCFATGNSVRLMLHSRAEDLEHISMMLEREGGGEGGGGGAQFRGERALEAMVEGDDTETDASLCSSSSDGSSCSSWPSLTCSTSPSASRTRFGATDSVAPPGEVGAAAVAVERVRDVVVDATATHSAVYDVSDIVLPNGYCAPKRDIVLPNGLVLHRKAVGQQSGLADSKDQRCRDADGDDASRGVPCLETHHVSMLTLDCRVIFANVLSDLQP